MKTKSFIIMGVVLINGLLLTKMNLAQETKVEAAKEKVKNAKLELKNAQTENDKEFTQYKTEVNLKISANEKSIAEFKEKIKAENGENKTKYDKKIISLEAKNDLLRKKIADYKYEGKDNWVKFKRGFNHEMNVVGKSIKNLFSPDN